MTVERTQVVSAAQSNTSACQGKSSVGRKMIKGKNYSYCAERSRLFWGNLNKVAASEILATKPSGSYLLRRSEHPLWEYALSQKTASTTIHIRIGFDEITRRYNMDGSPVSSRGGFECVINLIESWSRVHREFGLRGLRRPVHVTMPDDVPSYVNVETDSVCFHDSKDAESRVRQFVRNYLDQRKSIGMLAE